MKGSSIASVTPRRRAPVKKVPWNPASRPSKENPGAIRHDSRQELCQTTQRAARCGEAGQAASRAACRPAACPRCPQYRRRPPSDIKQRPGGRVKLWCGPALGNPCGGRRSPHRASIGLDAAGIRGLVECVRWRQERCPRLGGRTRVSVSRCPCLPGARSVPELHLRNAIPFTVIDRACRRRMMHRNHNAAQAFLACGLLGAS
jgi:hypothetical protein